MTKMAMESEAALDNLEKEATAVEADPYNNRMTLVAGQAEVKSIRSQARKSASNLARIRAQIEKATRPVAAR